MRSLNFKTAWFQLVVIHWVLIEWKFPVVALMCIRLWQICQLTLWHFGKQSRNGLHWFLYLRLLSSFGPHLQFFDQWSRTKSWIDVSNTSVVIYVYSRSFSALQPLRNVVRVHICVWKTYQRTYQRLLWNTESLHFQKNTLVFLRKGWFGRGIQKGLVSHFICQLVISVKYSTWRNPVAFHISAQIQNNSPGSL